MTKLTNGCDVEQVIDDEDKKKNKGNHFQMEPSFTLELSTPIKGGKNTEMEHVFAILDLFKVSYALSVSGSLKADPST